MNFDVFQPLFDWIAQHQTWAVVIIFLIAMGESLAIVGMFVPGAVLMVGSGALIATGTLPFWPILWSAVAGAIVGDGLSFWLGHHYKEKLRTLWPFSRYPGLIDQGQYFLKKHGGKSVAFGRFVGPVRAIIPAVAGMMGMSPLRFIIANVSSALVWAPAYLLPGIVFGASLGVAAEVASRLAALVIGSIVLLWLSLLVLKRVYLYFSPRAQEMANLLINWGRSHKHLGQITAALLDPQQPEARGLAIVAIVLTGAALLILLIFQQFTVGPLMARLDYSTYQLLQGLRTSWADHVMIAVSQLGDTSVQVVLVLAVTLWLMARQHWLASAHWLAVAGFAWGISWILKQSLKIPRPTALEGGMYEGAMSFSFPSSHTLVATCLYGFLAVLIARELPQRWRWLSYAAALLAIFNIAASRLYLGAHWLSDVLGGLLLGLIWTTIVGIAFRRHYTPSIPLSGLVGIPAAVLLTFGSWYVVYTHDDNVQRYTQRHHIERSTMDAWLNTGWQQLPGYRIDSRGLEMQPLNVQWAGSLDILRHHLSELGWQAPLPLSTKNALRWLKPGAELTDLPRLPLNHLGHVPALTMILPEHTLILQLWPTDLVLENKKRIWTGYIAREEMTQLPMINYPVVSPDVNTPMQQFKPFVAMLNWQIKQRPADERSGKWHREVLLMWPAD